MGHPISIVNATLSYIFLQNIIWSRGPWLLSFDDCKYRVDDLVSDCIDDFHFMFSFSNFSFKIGLDF